MRTTESKVRAMVHRIAGTGTADAMFEAAALLVGAVFFVLGFVVSLPIFWGRELAIAGPGSLGAFVAIGGAAVAVLAFALGRVATRPRPKGTDAALRRDNFADTDDHLRWYDLAAIAFAHAAVAYLGWLGIAQLLEQSFTDAPVFALPGAILVAVSFALTAYVCFLSAVALTPMSLSLVLAIFLVVGAFASMLAASDPHWWQDNLSALGMSTNVSAVAFNGTLVIAGIMVTTISRYATAGLPVDTREQRRGRRIVRGGLILMGIFLACVGIFPVDEFFALHNTVATGMAVELIAAVLIFSWIIVFLRTAGSVGAPLTDPTRQDAASDPPALPTPPRG